jgi:hypothetical protein
MIADTFTKPLARFNFEKFCLLLGVLWSRIVLEGECCYIIFICFILLFYLSSQSLPERLHRVSPLSFFHSFIIMRFFSYDS